MNRAVSVELQAPLRTESKSDEYWSIWLDPLVQGEKIVQTHWGHLFHRMWLKTSYERGSELCPNWRNSLKKRSQEKNDLSSTEVLSSSGNFASSQNTTDDNYISINPS